MKKIKNLLMMLIIASVTLSCSIDRLDEIAQIPIQSMDTELVEVGDSTYPWGGYWVYFYADGVKYNEIFLSNGANGADGKDGINGIDGIDGVDGVSANIWTEYIAPNTDESYPWGGYWFYTQVGDVIEKVFISNGSNGINGIDGIDGEDGVSSVVRTERVEGGYNLYVVVTQSSGVSTESVTFIRDAVDGTNGLDGTNGTNGINGIDGIDGTNGTNGTNGVSVTVKTVKVEDGYILYITDINGTYEVYIENGADGSNGLDGTNGLNGTDGTNGQNGTNGTDGINGIDGVNGTNGTDGTNATIWTVRVDDNVLNIHGYWLYTQVGTIIEYVFVSDGADGTNGLDGKDGEDGEDYTNGDGTVTICHKVTHTNKDSEVWTGLDYVTLTLNLSEYVEHIYEFHNGNSSQNDAWGSCEE
jgi:hypothetical protein